MDKKTFASKLKAKRSTSSRLVILAYKEHIQEALAAGHTRQEIFDVLSEEGIYQHSYPSFSKAIAKYLLNNDESEKPAAVVANDRAVAKEPKRIKSENQKPKIFDPKPNKDELV